MKKMDMFCASQASTAICISMDQPSSSSSSIQLGGRNIDRHNPVIRDHKRTPKALPLAPCTSQTPPINPQPYHIFHKTKLDNKNNKENDTQCKKKKKKNKSFSSFSSSAKQANENDDIDKNNKKKKDVMVQRKSWAQLSDFITPPGSTRYLLGENNEIIDGFSDFDPVLGLVTSGGGNDSKRLISQAVDSKRFSQSVVSVDSKIFSQVHSNKEQHESTSSISNSEERPSNQVVVLRVSLHCRGCEGKVRKHLSRMEGVSSFNIDFAAKKVTIVGDVTPLSVLASVSKVKSAQFWTPTTTIPSTPAVNSQHKT